MILCLDNAPYHRRKGPHHLDLGNMLKGSLLKLLRTQEQATAQMEEDKGVVHARYKDAADGVADKAGRIALKKALANGPELLEVPAVDAASRRKHPGLSGAKAGVGVVNVGLDIPSVTFRNKRGNYSSYKL